VFASATIVGTDATGNGVAAASAPLGCGGAGFDGVAGDGVTVGRMAGASASSARGGASDRGGGGITGACSLLGGPCVALPPARAWAKSAAMYFPQVVA